MKETSAGYVSNNSVWGMHNAFTCTSVCQLEGIEVKVSRPIHETSFQPDSFSFSTRCDGSRSLNPDAASILAEAGSAEPGRAVLHFPSPLNANSRISNAATPSRIAGRPSVLSRDDRVASRTPRRDRGLRVVPLSPGR